MQRLLVEQNNWSDKSMNAILFADLSTFVVLEKKTDILFRLELDRVVCSFSENSFNDAGVITLIMKQLLTSIPDLLRLGEVSKKSVRNLQKMK